MKENFKINLITFLIFLFILIIQVYLISIFIYRLDDYHYLKLLSNYYGLLGDYENQKLYLDSFYFFQKLVKTQLLVVILLSNYLVFLFQAIRTFKKYQQYPKIIADYKKEVKMVVLVLYVTFITYLMFLNIYFNFNLNIIVVLYIIIILSLPFINLIILKELTNDVGKRMKLIDENKFIPDDFTVKNDKLFNRYYLLAIILLTPVFIFYLQLSIPNITIYQSMELPNSYIFNKDTTLFLEYKNKDVNMCENFEDNIFCHTYYDYQWFFDNYQLSTIQLKTNDQKLIDGLMTGKYKLSINYNFNSYEIEQKNILIENTLVIINVENILNQNDDLEFDVLSINIKNEQDTNINIDSIIEYQISLEKKIKSRH